MWFVGVDMLVLGCCVELISSWKSSYDSEESGNRGPCDEKSAMQKIRPTMKKKPKKMPIPGMLLKE